MMREMMHEMAPDKEAAWQQLEPLLHEALDSLSAGERYVLLLRYFEGRSLRETGEALGISEDAARLRVERAIEKMRRYFSKRGYLISGVVLAGLLLEKSVQAAPTPFVAATLKMASVAALHSATAEMVGVKVFSLCQGVMHSMLINKASVAVGIFIGIGLAGAGVGQLDFSRASAPNPVAVTSLAQISPRPRQTNTLRQSTAPVRATAVMRTTVPVRTKKASVSTFDPATVRVERKKSLSIAPVTPRTSLKRTEMNTTRNTPKTDGRRRPLTEKGKDVRPIRKSVTSHGAKAPLVGAVLATATLTGSASVPSAGAQPPAGTTMSRNPAPRGNETQIEEIIPGTDSVRVTTAHGPLDLWIGSAKFIQEERGLSFADLKVGDSISRFESPDFWMSLPEGAVPVTSLEPFICERPRATDPDQIFPSTPALHPTFSNNGRRVISRSGANRRVDETVLEGAGVTWTITKPDFTATNGTIKWGEAGDGIKINVLEPEAMTFTRYTRIKSTDIAVGQTVSAKLTLEPNGKVVCHQLTVIIEGVKEAPKD